jgi:hypothetical protein
MEIHYFFKNFLNALYVHGFNQVNCKSESLCVQAFRQLMQVVSIIFALVLCTRIFFIFQDVCINHYT